MTAETESESPSVYHLTIQEFPCDERPRERLKNYGATALSNAELLAILIRVGNPGENAVALGTRLLIEFGGLSIVYMPRRQDGEWKIEESRPTDAVLTQNRSRPVPITGEDSRTGD